MGLGEVLTTPHLKTGLDTKRKHEAQTWAEDSVRPKQWKWNTESSTWNVRSLYWSGSPTTVAKDSARYIYIYIYIYLIYGVCSMLGGTQ